MYLPKLKSVALPVPEIRGGSYVANPNLEEGGRRWYLSKERWGVPISPPCILFLYQHLFARNFRLQFWVGVANPQFWGRGGRRGSEMVPFERALVSFFRPSIVSFPLSLRVSEISPLLFSSTPLFPYPTSSFLKISPCSPGSSPSRWIAFWLQRAKVLD